MPAVMPPRIETRAAQSYLAIAVEGVRQPEIGARLPPLLPQLFAALAKRGVAPAGAPFFRYVSMGSGEGMSVDVGVPVAQRQEGDAELHADELPAGRYAVLTHLGSFMGVHEANLLLHDWLREHRIDAAPVNGRASPGAHVEVYVTDPAQEPDVSKWVTLVEVRLQD